MTFKEFEIEEKAQELVINKIKELMIKINEKREAVIDKMFEEMGYSKDEYMQMLREDRIKARRMLSSPYLLDDITSIDVYIDDELVSTFICNHGTIKRHDDSYSMEMKYGYKIYKRM